MPIKVKVGNTWKDSKMGDKVSSDKLSGSSNRSIGYSNDKSINCTNSTCNASCIGNLNASCNTCTSFCSSGCGTSCKRHCTGCTGIGTAGT